MENLIVPQDVRKFTVQIINSQDTTSGTAFVIRRNTSECLLVTCKHVVIGASENRTCDYDTQIQVYFPQLNQRKIATVIAYSLHPEDDVAILRISEQLIKSVKEAVIGSNLDFQLGLERRFSSFGYREVENFDGLWTYGSLRDELKRRGDRRKQKARLLQLYSDEINTGMSGAPVLDQERNLVVGIISEKYFARGNIDQNLAVAIDCGAILDLIPDFELWTDFEYPLKPFTPPLIPDSITQLYEPSRFSFPLRPNLFDAPEVRSWANRPDLLNKLRNDWNNNHIHVISLYGFGGEGKSHLARKWIEEVKSTYHFDGMIWLSASDEVDIAGLIYKILDYLLSEFEFDRMAEMSLDIKVALIGKIAKRHNLVFILDEIDKYQDKSHEKYGQINDRHLKMLIEFLLEPDCQSKCIITSRAQLTDFSLTTLKSYRVESFKQSDAVNWLSNQIKASESNLIRLVDKWKGYPLALSIIAAQIQQKHRGEMGPDLLTELPQPDPNKSSYQNFEQIVKFYFNELRDPEKEMLVLIAMFGPLSVEIIYYIRATAKSELRFQDKHSFEATANHLHRLRLLRRNQSRDFYVHPVVAEECNRLAVHYNEGEIRRLKINLCRYYLSRMMPDKSRPSRNRDERQALYYLYSAFGIIDERAKKDLEIFLRNLRREFPSLPDEEYIINNGRYILIDELGNGATGTVWLAYQRGLSRLVALKIMKSDAIDVGELEFLPNLDNAYIIPIYDIFFEPGLQRVVIVMKYLPGGTLRNRMSKVFRNSQYFQLQEVQRLLRCLSDGLYYLHNKYVSHEDIKPENIIFDTNEIPILVDFGFARDTSVSYPTKNGEPGTLRYMAPEKILDIPDVERRREASDQYSVAIIVYEALSGGIWPYGSIPEEYTGEDVVNIANSHIDDDMIPIQTWRPDLPDAINDVLKTALSKKPEERYVNMQEFIIAFDKAANQPIILQDTQILQDSTEVKDEEGEPLENKSEGEGSTIFNTQGVTSHDNENIATSFEPVHIPTKSESERTHNELSNSASGTRTRFIAKRLFWAIVISISMLVCGIATILRLSVLPSETPRTQGAAIAPIDQSVTNEFLPSVVLQVTRGNSTVQFTETVESTAQTSAKITSTATEASSDLATSVTSTEQDVDATAALQTASPDIISIQVMITQTKDMPQHTATHTPFPQVTKTVNSEGQVTGTSTAPIPTVTLALIATPTFIPTNSIGVIQMSSASFAVFSAFDLGCLNTGDDETCRNELIYITHNLITIGQYRTCYTLKKCLIPARAGDHFNFRVNDVLPVVDITWQMAQDFCAFYGGRLPTQEEWESVIRSKRMFNPGYREWTSKTRISNNIVEVLVGQENIALQQYLAADEYRTKLGFRCVFKPPLN